MFNKKIAIELAVGIIILIALAFGGYIWLMIPKENSFNKTTANKIPIAQPTQNIDYYQTLADNCKKMAVGLQKCCLDSVVVIKNGGFITVNEQDNCPSTWDQNKSYVTDRLGCTGSYIWCTNDPAAKAKDDKIKKQQEEQNKIDNETMQNAKTECEKKSGKECGFVMCEGPECGENSHGWQPMP